MHRQNTGSTGKVNRQVGSRKAFRFFCASGFTLVEVVLAMALLGLAVVSMATILAHTLGQYGNNARKWRLLLACQRSMEDEIRTLTEDRTVLAKRLARGSWKHVNQDGNIRVTLRSSRSSAHVLQLQVVATAGGDRVELQTLLADRWQMGAKSRGRGKTDRRKHGH